MQGEPAVALPKLTEIFHVEFTFYRIRIFSIQMFHVLTSRMYVYFEIKKVYDGLFCSFKNDERILIICVIC